MIDTSLIKRWEKCRLEPYLDAVGVWTVGWGHKLTGAKDPYFRTLTQGEADALLASDVAAREARVRALVRVPLSEGQLVALTSFEFNTGALARSTLLARLNVSDYVGASNEFMRWIKGHKAGRLVTLAGLISRRAEERALFLGSRDGTTTPLP